MVKTSATDSIIKHYLALLESFETVNAESHDDYGCRARGVLSLLQRYETLFGLHLSFLILVQLNRPEDHCSHKIHQSKRLLVQLT